MARMSRKPDVVTADQRNTVDIGGSGRPPEDRTADYMFYLCPGLASAVVVEIGR